MSTLTQSLIYLLALVILIAVAVRAARLSRGRGYRYGRDVIVRCRDGHLFMTTWIPGMSVKAVRLGLVRMQHCPVGDHVVPVRLMRDEELSSAERLQASHHHDSGAP